MDVSVVICGHNEGRLLHRTLRSVFRSVKFFKSKIGSDIEVILSLGSPSKATKDYLLNSNFKKKIKIYENNFEDIALSRNFGVEKASGKYIAFIDGDNLFCENWLVEAYQYAEITKEECLLHPEYLVNFESRNTIWKRISSTDPRFKFGSLISFNPWDSTVFGEKRTFEKYKFRVFQKNSGWGNIDWDFICTTLAENINHVVLNGTVVFVRTKRGGGLSDKNFLENKLLYKNKLFELGTLEKLVKKDEEQQLEPRKKSLKHIILEPFPKFHLFLYRLKLNVFRKLNNLNGNKIPMPDWIPSWLYNEWKIINNQIEPETFPPVHGTQGFYVLDPAFEDNLAKLYLDTIAKVGDHIIIFPHIKVGGAEKVLFTFIKSINKIFPNDRITVITTEPTESPWCDRLPVNTCYFDIGNLPNLSNEQKEKLLILLLTQLRPQNIYVHSTLGMILYEKYGKALSGYSKLYAFMFSRDYDGYGRLLGYVQFFDNIIDYVDKVFTDNTAIIKFLCNMYGFESTKFVTLFQPVEMVDISNKKYSIKRPMRLLWASRLDRVKHPEIAYQIAKACIDLPIKIDMYGSSMYTGDVFGTSFNVKILKNLTNIDYKGPFYNGLKEIVEGYDAFLYTSEYDGMPNVILEAAGAGLPIISSSVGGIPDLLEDKKNSLLINQYDDINEYRQKIIYALKHRKEFNEYALKAYYELKNRYNVNVYESTLKSAIKKS